jgi:NADPH-dependent ferric siderophore reductase
MSKGNYRNIEVLSKEQLSPHLMRINFHGSDLEDFPVGFEGGYIKLILEQDKKNIPEDIRPKMRSYTVSCFDNKSKILTIDLMVNNHKGHTSTWAMNTTPGDKVVIAGPGPRKLTNYGAKKYIFFGDLTSINALLGTANLIPSTSCGEIFLLVPSLEDRREIAVNKNLRLNWLPADETDYFTDIASQTEWIDQDTIVFAAGEANRIKSLKNYLTSHIGLSLDQLFISGYWREGLNDEEYRAEKKKNS